MSQRQTEPNPLLASGLPAFDRIAPEHAPPAIEQRLGEYRALITHIESLGEAVDYASVVAAETEADNALARVFSTIGHLHAVNNTPAWREAYQACLAPMTRFHTERGQNRGLFQAYQRLAERADFGQQSPAMRRLIEHEIRDFRLSGVVLPEKQRTRFAELAVRLSELGNRFGNQVLDATEGHIERFDNPEQLAGLPDSELDLLAGMAAQAGRDGWQADLSYPAYRAIITYADDRQLRERIYRAYVTRSSDRGPHAGESDNTAIVTEMLALRREQAALLGFSSHAEMRLTTRMAETPAEIELFLLDLAGRARPLAMQQLDELTKFASELGAETPLAPWDIAYYSEKLRDARLGINQEMLKPWFEVDQVFSGLFDIAGDLFEVAFRRDDTVATWHDSVSYYRVTDQAGREIAGLFLDIYSRSRKSGGAWMDVCRSRLVMSGREQRPVAYLTCNFSPPRDDRPSLLTHDDVVTLWHEFGHCLHHLLTRIDLPAVGGISGVEWDAVELPSQLMEGFAWEPDALDRYARHVDSGQPLPPGLLEGLKADRQFQGALALVRQIEFALCDLRLHHQSDPDPVAVMRAVHDEVGVIPMIADNRYLMSFSHLFDGGYAAGYYSYLWAERLARDGFGLFREQGIFNRQAGLRLLDEILAVGSSRPMAESWRAFRGRPPELDPLLESYGVAA